MGSLALWLGGTGRSLEGGSMGKMGCSFQRPPCWCAPLPKPPIGSPSSWLQCSSAPGNRYLLLSLSGLRSVWCVSLARPWCPVTQSHTDSCGCRGEAPTASKFGRIIAPTKTGVRLSRVTGPQGGCRTNDEKMPGEWQRQDDGGS